MSRFASLEVRIGPDRLRLAEFEADFVDPAGGEVFVDYDAEAEAATVHVLGRREIADGSLTCSIDGLS